MKVYILNVDKSVSDLAYQSVNDYLNRFMRHPQGFKNAIMFHNELGEKVEVWRKKQTIFVLIMKDWE